MVVTEDGKNIKLESIKYENLFILLDWKNLGYFQTSTIGKFLLTYIILNLEKNEWLVRYVFYILNNLMAVQ